jgi:hypothetical protein
MSHDIFPDLPGARVFRLAGPAGDGRHAYCNESGAYLGRGTALLERFRDGSGALRFRPRPETTLARMLSKAYGRVIHTRRLMTSLRSVAIALDRGDLALANIALVHGEIAPLPDEAAATRLAKADRLLRAEADAKRAIRLEPARKAGFDPDEPRLPQGQSGGGEWTDGGGTATQNPRTDAPRTRQPRRRLTTEEVGNIVYNETRSLSGPGIEQARLAMANAIRNGENLPTGRPQMATQIVGNVSPAEAATYQASQDAATQADAERASGIDKANGSAHFNMRNGPSTAPFDGDPIRAHFGPFQNTYPTEKLPDKTNVYINIYR